ncbi:hypothetical protein ABFS82_08G129600 [Erythranthe guttata]|uniref:uncharacterized protein LOC105951540 n=1 Tax=Erythranthe guttata TaxID=4155 RepID=UPI00064D9D5A|nr:PREDICTED: uncharacterized protein LOC105951540 [Erythranthe guttata]|eukprot:XP_012830448.1 PREDICTED: uncharacterized protein LOC105951540 [Erythranthe guttata]
MATAKLIETHTQGAEICHGSDICKSKIQKVLEEFSFPKGLLPLDDIEEFGFNRNTGFVWMKMKKKKEHKFKSIGQTTIYNAEITCFLEKFHMSKVTGVKAKEMMIPVAVYDILVRAPAADMVKFTSAVGLSRAHPISAFELEDAGSATK